MPSGISHVRKPIESDSNVSMSVARAQSGVLTSRYPHWPSVPAAARSSMDSSMLQPAAQWQQLLLEERYPAAYQ